MSRVSVIIPNYDRAAMLCDCVRSVLETGYANLEVVVVDDCSPDDNPWTSRSMDTTPPNCRLNSLPEGLEWPTACSPNAFMMTRASFVQTRGFAEGTRIMFEETDFGYRVTANVGQGWISRLARTSHRAWHTGGSVRIVSDKVCC